MSTFMTYTQADFDQLSWHDNYIYGFHISIGDCEEGDWRNDLEGLASLLPNHLPNYRNLMASYFSLQEAKQNFSS